MDAAALADHGAVQTPPRTNKGPCSSIESLERGADLGPVVEEVDGNVPTKSERSEAFDDSRAVSRSGLVDDDVLAGKKPSSSTRKRDRPRASVASPTVAKRSGQIAARLGQPFRDAFELVIVFDLRLGDHTFDTRRIDTGRDRDAAQEIAGSRRAPTGVSATCSQGVPKRVSNRRAVPTSVLGRDDEVEPGRRDSPPRRQPARAGTEQDVGRSPSADNSARRVANSPRQKGFWNGAPANRLT